MPFIDLQLFSLMKSHLANSFNDNSNVMVSTPIDMDRSNDRKFFGDYFEYSDDESLFTKTAPILSESETSSSSFNDSDLNGDLLHKRHNKSVTFAASPKKIRHPAPKEKKNVCRMLFYASKITKRPSSFLKRRKQKLEVYPQLQKESVNKLRVFFCHECGMKIYTMSNENTHLVTEL